MTKHHQDSWRRAAIRDRDPDRLADEPTVCRCTRWIVRAAAGLIVAGLILVCFAFIVMLCSGGFSSHG